jgi:cell division protein FtsW (lipid II flippase)/cell division protein FtsI/penicillin-binding protein 2
MRIVVPVPERAVGRSRTRATVRANVELLALMACSVVVLIGLLLTYWGKAESLARVEQDIAAGAVVDLHRLRSPNEIAVLLPMFESPFERQVAARALFRRATLDAPPLEHVGDLASVTIPAAEIRNDRRLVELRSRLERHAGLENVPVLTAADVASIRPRAVVRTLQEFRARIGRAAMWFFAAFGIAHLVRRWRGSGDDPLLLPVLLLLSGIGLMSMITLRDPLRDTVIASTFVVGIVIGSLLLTVASELDLEASGLRRAVIAPLGLAVALAALLLVFGSGPGSSGAKVNVLGVQPVEAIRLLVVLALAGYFARRLEFLRELSEAPTPSRPWLRYVRMPRWRDVRPVIVSMSLVLTFFFLQKDLGPALVLSCVFLALYGIARGRAVFVGVGFTMLLAGFVVADSVGFPATVRQRVAIWLDPWNNGVPGGDQIAHGLWALSTGALWGSGPGLGSPHVIPAAHTDFVLAAVGEELGFVGLAVVVALYGLLCWRCLRVAARAPGDYTAFVAVGIALALVVQALVIASGVMGLLPLSGVVTPFLSYGRSSMLANFAAVGIVMGIARRSGPVRQHLGRPIGVLAGVLAIAAAALVSRTVWIQVINPDRLATASSLSEQGDGGYRFAYNPRLLAAGRLIGRGTIYDRNELPLATSRADEIRTLAASYRTAGIVPEQTCAPDLPRCYPLAGLAFHVVGDWNWQTNFGARNSSYIERDSDSTLKGFDDQARVVDVRNPRTGATERTVRREYRELLPVARDRYRRNSSEVQALFTRNRDVHTSIDARLQMRVAAVLRNRIESGGYARGAAAVLDVDTGEVLASVSYPWPATSELQHHGAAAADPVNNDRAERLFDRPRYGLYPPGSAFKLLVAGAALRANLDPERSTFACIRLRDGRVGNYVPGSSRPVRDDPMDTVPHGTVDLHRGLVVSCNAYFAQLAVRLGPRPLLDAASLFQIDVAQPQTAAGLTRTLAQAGYGQGQVIVSPLKMARIAAAIARRGTVPQVSWIHALEPDATSHEERFLSAEDAALLSRYMRDVVMSGTGRTLLSNPTAIAGKTGTAEVANGRAHSWFAGFAPFGGPRKIAFAVIVENAGYGARAAAPIAGDIVSAAREIGLFK